KNSSYFNKLISEYYPQRDPTQLRFYELIWELANKYGIKIGSSKKDFSNYFSLRGDRYIKKAPGTETVYSKERFALEKQYQGKGQKQLISEFPKVIQHLANNQIGKIFRPLLDLINQQRIYFMIDDLEDSVFYPRKDNNIDLGILFFIVPNGSNYEIHLTEKLWEEKKKDKEFLTQILVYTYIQNFAIQIENLSPHTYAGWQALNFASKEAQKEEVNDLDRYYLDYAVKTKNIKYFLKLLDEYVIFLDPQDTFKQAIYRRLKKLERKNRNIIIQNISTPKEFLSYYGYLFEYKFKNLTKEKRLIKISRELEKIAKSNSNISNFLNDSTYIIKAVIKRMDDKKAEIQLSSFNNNSFTYDKEFHQRETIIKVGNSQTLYIPQHIGAFLELEEIVDLSTISVDQKEVDRLFQALSEIERDHIQDFLPFINWLIRIIEEKKNKTNKRTLVVGIYGPSSSGKSTLVDILIKKLSEIYELPNQTGIKVNFLSSDSYLHPSQFRYIQSKNKRFTFIKGQPIYNLHRFWRDLVDLLGKKTISTPYDEHAPGVQQKGKDRKIDGSQLEVLVIDFTCFGLDEFILEKVDLLVPVLFKDDTFRLARRLVRDTKPKEQGGRNLSFRSILDDMTEKQYQELYQTMKYIVKNYGNYLWLQDEKKIYRNKSSSPINIKAPFSSDLTEKEKQVIDNEIKKAYDEGRIKPLTISEAIKGILKESEYLSILKDLEENKLIVKAVDLGSDLGFIRQKEEDGLIFAYTRKEQNTIVIYLSGSLAFLLDSSNYINEALIKDIKKDKTLTDQQKQEKIKSITGPLDLAFAQIILHEYMLANNFSYQYALTAELSLENKLKGISVLSRFIILKLAELGNLSYLNKVLKQYNPQVDFDQELKNILIEAYRLYLKLYLRVEQIQLFNEDAFGIISLAKQKAIEDINSEIDESLKKAKISKEQDIRATANGSLLYEIVYRIGRALGEDLTKDLQDYKGNWPKKVNKVGIGIDARISSERIRSALKDGLLDSGINVVEFREHLTTTPMISFAGYNYQDLDLVINITASHNDYTYNGIKIVYVQKDSEGKTQDVINIETEILNNLLKVAGNLSLGTNQQIQRGSLEERDILTPYKSHVKEYLLKVLGDKREEKPLSGYKFAVDASSGTGGFYAKILEELGAEVLEINIAP
ncbi:MAG: hypothetical protein NC904_08485, partial [Candidatus Omnitrophica bacterium]|nr:hypothetical protein [Candidatus Omnitrophota bacterium]